MLWKCNWKSYTEICSDWKREKKTQFLSNITTRLENGLRGRLFLNLDLQAFCFRSSDLPERERITTESSVVSSKTSQCHNNYTAHGQRNDCVYKTNNALGLAFSELIPMKMTT
jgi:hypothetical protein